MNENDALAVAIVAFAAVKITALTYSHIKSKATAAAKNAATKEQS